MGKMRLHKVFRFLGFVVLLLIGVNVFLLLTGWYEKKVEGKYGAIHKVVSDEYSADRTKSSNILSYFYVFDGLDMGYDISIYVKEGTVELDILDADGVKMIFDGMEQSVVASYKLENSDKVHWDLSSLEPGHQYALAVYGNEDFIGEVTQKYYIKRWQRIYNQIMMNLGKEARYVP